MTFVQEGPAPPSTGDTARDAALHAAARATLERQGRRAVGVSTEWAVSAGRMRRGHEWLRRTSPWFGAPEADAQLGGDRELQRRVEIALEIRQQRGDRGLPARFVRSQRDSVAAFYGSLHPDGSRRRWDPWRTDGADALGKRPGFRLGRVWRVIERGDP